MPDKKKYNDERKAEPTPKGLAPPARRKQKDYDDDLLVELIARGDLTSKQIAQRVGISQGFVTDISYGRRRGDLQPRINAATRSYVRQAKRRTVRQGGPQADYPPAPQSHRKKEYDDDRLVEMIAAGNISHKKIAAEIGISISMVSCIARGEGRSDLQPRIHALVRGRCEQFERLAVAILKPALVKQARVALEDDGETGRKARQHIIDTFRYPPDPSRLAGPGPRSRASGSAGELAHRPKLPLRSMTELSPKLKAAVLKELGGPEMGPEDYADTPEDGSEPVAEDS